MSDFDYDDTNYNYSTLMDYLRIRTGRKEAESDFEKRLVHRLESGVCSEEPDEKIIRLAKADMNKIPLSVEDETAKQLCALKYYDEKLFDIILNDIKNAYLTIQSEIGEKYPDWKEKFPLTDINLSIITDDDDWKHFCYLNELDNLVLPCSAEAIMPIRLRFKKKETNLRYALEIEFIDVVCLADNENTKRVLYLHSTYVAK